MIETKDSLEDLAEACSGTSLTGKQALFGLALLFISVVVIALLGMTISDNNDAPMLTQPIHDATLYDSVFEIDIEIKTIKYEGRTYHLFITAKGDISVFDVTNQEDDHAGRPIPLRPL